MNVSKVLLGTVTFTAIAVLTSTFSPMASADTHNGSVTAKVPELVFLNAKGRNKTDVYAVGKCETSKPGTTQIWVDIKIDTKPSGRQNANKKSQNVTTKRQFGFSWRQSKSHTTNWSTHSWVNAPPVRGILVCWFRYWQKDADGRGGKWITGKTAASYSKWSSIKDFPN